MSICNHGLAPEKCILCKKLLPPEPPQNHKMPMAAPVQNMNEPISLVAPVSANVEAQKITDPQAKNVLQLAQEYAQAQDDVSIIRANVKQLQDTLAESKIKLGEAESSCEKKRIVLSAAVHGTFSAVAAVMIESEENEEPSYVNKYQK